MDNNIRSPVKFFLITSLHVNTLQVLKTII